MALALSSDPAAQEHLFELQMSLTEGRATQPGFADQVNEALRRASGAVVESRYGPRACCHD